MSIKPNRKKRILILPKKNSTQIQQLQDSKEISPSAQNQRGNQKFTLNSNVIAVSLFCLASEFICLQFSFLF